MDFPMQICLQTKAEIYVNNYILSACRHQASQEAFSQNYD